MSNSVDDKTAEKQVKTNNMHAYLIGGVALLGAAYLFVVKDIGGFGILNKKPEFPPVVVLDSNRIVDAAIQGIVNSPTLKSDDEITKIGIKVSSDLERILTSYAAQGTVVINKDATIASPYWLDVTESVAKEIGIDVNQSSLPK